MKRALITGITGQDGSYLAELLLSEGYEVHGMVRRVALEDHGARLGRIAHIADRLKLHAGELCDYASVCSAVRLAHPDECYHLAAQSFVADSFCDPFGTMATNVGGTLNILEALRWFRPGCRMYFAGSSEMFGQVAETPQSERTPFYPRSPYGVSKVAGFDLVRNYREAYGMHVSSGILFNHESPRRGMEFVTRKISDAAARIKLGLAKEVRLGNLEVKRDWGFAGDYVGAMWMMLQQPKPDDYVVATGEAHTVLEFAEAAFRSVGLDWVPHVFVDDRLLRPAEVRTLTGDASKAREVLGWEPKVRFEGLVKMMVESDLKRISSGCARAQEAVR